ncbi:unnamed protein product [Rotaria magnacalcarata]|uniref:UBP-type domain-containing protein n=1 Tax=Rotaria magnacalcarata TaxID=392030 RepID=A0A819ZAJ4_9BILA|nr:unnamed protein product [Rotaria magnacalcarata]CAF2216664.1 unnamed protein product [Rotaria magnacalcarata]CAF3992267.1 unnamed protein product [Rotaria magnacalcarata]CAF4163877.1 unnamed protein product [Rotaria magnacalcarata]CAF4174019.1 unnamed protein product [Rotaria magnacalcarata]
MSQSNSSASSEPPADDNRRGPFAIVPKYDCPHLGENAYVLLQSTQQQDDQQPPCVDCNNTQENWACLHEDCNYIGCSRYQQKHMLKHHESTGHNICLSYSDRSVFCYACDSYIDSPQLHLLSRQLNQVFY